MNFFQKHLKRLEKSLRKRYCTTNVMEFCLQKLKEKGFSPEVIVDCGAYIGSWTKMVKKVFPNANILMIEPQASKEPLLVQVCNEFSGTVDYVRCLLGSEQKEKVTFFEVEGTETNSSVLEDVTIRPGKVVTLKMTTLDDILREKKVKECTFLKLDVQGYELEVLKGAKEALKNAEVILLEVSFIRCNRSAPLFHEVVAFMKERGFLVYDVSPLPRWKDNTLLQADVFFVKEGSIFRQIDFAVTP